MKRFGAPAQKPKDELELPDWSGMDDSSRRVSTDTALRLCEEYVVSGTAANKRPREREYVVEFTL